MQIWKNLLVGTHTDQRFCWNLPLAGRYVLTGEHILCIDEVRDVWTGDTFFERGMDHKNFCSPWGRRRKHLS